MRFRKAAENLWFSEHPFLIVGEVKGNGVAVLYGEAFVGREKNEMVIKVSTFSARIPIEDRKAVAYNVAKAMSNAIYMATRFPIIFTDVVEGDDGCSAYLVARKPELKLTEELAKFGKSYAPRWAEICQNARMVANG